MHRLAEWESELFPAALPSAPRRIHARSAQPIIEGNYPGIMKIFLTVLATVLLSACSNANAPAPTQPPAHASSATGPAPDASVVQRALATNGVQITGSLDAPAGFEGFVANYQGRPLPVYALPDRKHIVIGTLLDLQGHDLTSAAMTKSTSSAFGDTQWKELAGSTWFAEGDPRGTRIVYAFEDTRCPYCHKLWEASQPYLKNSHVQVRTILVAVIAPESLPEAANILDAKDPAAAWNKNEEHFGTNPPPGDSASAAAVAKVRANTELFQKLGFMGTPSVVWKDAQGKIHSHQGAPRDQQELDDIFGG